MSQYIKAQISGTIATAVDFSITWLMKEVGGSWYVTAVATGAAMGAVTSYLLNRYWVYQATHTPHHHQAFRYLLVAGGSWALNTGGVYVLTELTGISYMINKVFVSLVVGLTYNYFLAKNFVFAAPKKSATNAH